MSHSLVCIENAQDVLRESQRIQYAPMHVTSQALDVIDFDEAEQAVEEGGVDCICEETE